jgi:hypothetical protein
MAIGIEMHGILIVHHHAIVGMLNGLALAGNRTRPE